MLVGKMKVAFVSKMATPFLFAGAGPLRGGALCKFYSDFLTDEYNTSNLFDHGAEESAKYIAGL